MLSLSLLGPAMGAAPPDLVLLVGIDALGWDFLSRAKTPNLDRLAAGGVTTERLVPVFPSKTFPNFYSIATGLYPAHHGIVANNMYDPDLDAWFQLNDRSAVGDGRWWAGEPIWVTVEKAGLKAAAFFWPGTEARIQGVRPSHWQLYDESVPNRARVDQVLGWLDLPADQLPSLITLYFSDVDTAAHVYDLESKQVRRAVRAVDRAMGRLLAGLEKRGIFAQTNIVVVSDHGMTPISPDRVIYLDDYLDGSLVELVDWNPVLALRPRPGREEEVYAALAGAHPHLQVYRKDDLPDRFHYRDHRRIQPIIGLADEGWSITSRSRERRQRDRYRGANHGYDNQLLSMGATFVAAGPAFHQGQVVPPFENIHIYELLCALLGLEPAPNDGDLEVVRGVLREGGHVGEGLVPSLGRGQAPPLRYLEHPSGRLSLP
ncbi:MAG: ectonucleotide pyrophosphatase/phosphodiesterase [Thermoanaerobaculia bacterium]